MLGLKFTVKQKTWWLPASSSKYYVNCKGNLHNESRSIPKMHCCSISYSWTETSMFFTWCFSWSSHQFMSHYRRGSWEYSTVDLWTVRRLFHITGAVNSRRQRYTIRDLHTSLAFFSHFILISWFRKKLGMIFSSQLWFKNKIWSWPILGGW